MDAEALQIYAASYPRAVEMVRVTALSQMEWGDTVVNPGDEVELEPDVAAILHREGYASIVMNCAKPDPADYKRLFDAAVSQLAAIDQALGIGQDGVSNPGDALSAIAELKHGRGAAGVMALTVLRQIADLPRRTREQRLASACVHFIDTLIDIDEAFKKTLALPAETLSAAVAAVENALATGDLDALRQQLREMLTCAPSP